MKRNNSYAAWTRWLFCFAAILAATIAVEAKGACLQVRGDITADGKTNVSDLQCQIMNVMVHMRGARWGTAHPCVRVRPELADLNCDLKMNVADVQLQLKYVLRQPLSILHDLNQNQCVDACEEEPCVAEGETFPIVPGHFDCCPGLVPVGCNSRLPNGECMPCVGASYCTACGDGICGPGENPCRCPEDCLPPGECWSNRDCGQNEYCRFDDCLVGIGSCSPKPKVCPMIWEPVCGCDANDYPNACLAASYGQSVAHPGSCVRTPSRF